MVELAAVVVTHARTRTDHDHNVKLLMNGLVTRMTTRARKRAAGKKISLIKVLKYKAKKAIRRLP
jgi:hypothetical protein